jgi:hypothetical protein
MDPLAFFVTSPFVLLAAWCLLATVGYLLGQAKGREAEGILFGVFLGPIGWLLIAVGPDQRPKCAHCRGAMQPGATRCCHCGGVAPPPTICIGAPPPPPKLRKVQCPACSAENLVTPEEFRQGLRCNHCAAGFVPAAA